MTYLIWVPITSANVGLSVSLKTYGMITYWNIGISLSFLLYDLGVFKYDIKSKKLSCTVLGV